VAANGEVACDVEVAEECYEVMALANGEVACDEEAVGGVDLAKGLVELCGHDDPGGRHCGCGGLHGDRGGGACGPTSSCCMTVAQSAAPHARGGDGASSHAQIHYGT
jgi:hypothetical protein